MNTAYPNSRQEDYWETDHQAVRLGSPFPVDFYHLNQLHTFWRLGAADYEAVHDYFARRTVLGSYLYIMGLEQVLKQVHNLRFTPDDLDHIRLTYPELADEDFLAYLEEFRFRGDIWAMPEGQLGFGQNEPIIKVVSNLLEGWYLETMIMEVMNGAIGYATNATHFILSAGGRPVVDFGLRRTSGDGAKVESVRSVLGAGVAGTSNVQAARNLFGTAKRALGTMSHEAIQIGTILHGGDEKEAFKDYIRMALDRGEEMILLVDTFETVSGAQHAIDALREVGEERGITVKAKAFRIDSGDLYADAERIRALDPECRWFEGIFLTNDLAPQTIARIAWLDRKRRLITGLGAGTNLMNPPAVVGGVYKLSALKVNGVWESTLKISASDEKTTLPGDKMVYRQLKDGAWQADIICLADEPVPDEDCQPLLLKMMEHGTIVAAPRALDDIASFGRGNLARLPDRYKAYAGSAHFPVRVSPRLQALQTQIKTKMLAPKLEAIITCLNH